MAATIANIGPAPNTRHLDIAGIRGRRLYQYTGPTSYVQASGGGDSLTPIQCRLGIIEDIPEQALTNGTAILIVVWVPNANPALGGFFQWFNPSTGNEVAGGTNLSAYNGVFEIVGRP